VSLLVLKTKRKTATECVKSHPSRRCWTVSVSSRVRASHRVRAAVDDLTTPGSRALSHTPWRLSWRALQVWLTRRPDASPAAAEL